ncbi:ABC transporter ATP-binding protein [Brackiella oedipodis]|uniref:ABC transporter ATP-binding protein n=1 Tax=Brackiella oedipodis TaxID=124225 RepID=UPI0004916F50|nr:ABC transporter ATP-binding protein [Brackiella oedipodis]
MLKVEDLHLTFNKGTPIQTRALQGMSLSIPTGQFVTVIGSNGAGKSTLLNAVAGEVKVDHGKIFLDNKNVTKQIGWRRASTVARVFQDPMAGTCEDLSIEENLSLAYSRGRKRGFRFALNHKNREFFKKKLAVLGLGLEHRLSDRIGLLSGGQRQAVSLLMATLQNSKILLLDEHTAALDPRTADFVLQLTKKIVTSQKLTTMMVTHSMKQALELGERTIMLHQGKVVLDVAGEERAQLGVADLLEMFSKVRGLEIDDSLVLS